MSSVPALPPSGPVPTRRDSRWYFFGPNGLRAIWGVLLFCGLVALTGSLLTWALHPALGHLDPMRPWGMIAIEIMLFVAVLIPTTVLSRMEGRPLGVYGLPLRDAFGKYFWSGALTGLVMLSAVMLCMIAVKAYTFGTIALSPRNIVLYGILWAIGFLLVGFFEEFCFRGYMLYTLTRGIGFWPAAILLSLLFALAHRGNEGETWFGLAEIVLIAIVFCVSVQRTGSLWWAVGIHFSYDWGESFLYSVPNSGTTIVGHLSNAKLHGNSWLSGGTVGPEASLFNFVAEIALLLFVMWMYPTVQYPTGVEIARTTPQPETVLNLSEAETGEFDAIPRNDNKLEG